MLLDQLRSLENRLSLIEKVDARNTVRWAADEPSSLASTRFTLRSPTGFKPGQADLIANAVVKQFGPSSQISYTHNIMTVTINGIVRPADLDLPPEATFGVQLELDRFGHS